MKLVIETDAPEEIVLQFVESALRFSHIGTGWSSPMINTMIDIRSIEAVDDDGGNIRHTAEARATTHATAEEYARTKLHPSEV